MKVSHFIKSFLITTRFQVKPGSIAQSALGPLPVARVCTDCVAYWFP